ncbi:ACP S-malonyltransferase [Pandoraea sp. NPDC087047]|uniref:ACP S-malonyltransferase n=1 Tax=Pandoraea sp. NPDC087047 TaxID=3364390 RepID=UPI0037F59307
MNLLALVFPGQGAQKAYMGKDIFESSTAARLVFEEANDVLGWDVAKICFSGSELAFASTHSAQVAIFVVEIAMLEAIRAEAPIFPAFFAGHSLGEYSALVAAGGLAFSEGLQLINKRGQLMEAACQVDHGMLAVSGISIENLKRILIDLDQFGQPLDIACNNAPEQYVLSGDLALLRKTTELLSGFNVHTKRLKVSGAFHSRWMQESAREFREELKKVSWRKLKNGVISNVSGYPYPDDHSEWIDLLSQQLHRPVNWLKTIRFLYLHGVRKVVEIGPASILSQLNRSIIPFLETRSVCSIGDMEMELGFISKNSRAGNALAFVARSLSYAAATRNHNKSPSGEGRYFDEECGSLYSEVSKCYHQARYQSHEDNENLCRLSVRMLKYIFEKKGITKAEQDLRYRELSWNDPYAIL